MTAALPGPGYRLPSLRRGLAAAVAVLIVSTSALAYDAVFTGRGHVRAVAIAAVASAVMTLLGRLIGLRPVAVVVANVIMFFVVTGAALFWSDTVFGVPTASSLDAVGSGLTVGFRELVQTPTPVTGRSELFVPLVAFAWVACSLAIEIVVRASRPVWALLPLVGLIVGSVVLATGDDNRPLFAVAVAGLVLVFVAISGRVSADHAVTLVELGDATVSRPLVGAVAGIAVVSVSTLIGLALLTVLPMVTQAERYDVRDHISPPVQPSEGFSPVAFTKQQLNDATEPTVFTVEFDGARPEGVLLFRTAALDDYDGVVWRSSRLYRRIGDELPNDELEVGSVVSYRIQTTTDLPYDYLPVLGEPLTATVANGGFDAVTDTLLASGSAGPTVYTATSRYFPRIEGEVAQTNSSSGDEYDAFVALPDQAAGLLGGLFADVLAEAGTDGSRLLALESAFVDESFTYDTQAPSGQSLSSVASYLGERSPSVGSIKTGYAEQAAAAYAVVARLAGIPVRLAVGYRVEPDAGGPQVVDVTTAEAHVWVEAALDGLGWVAFDPIKRGQPGEPPLPPQVETGETVDLPPDPTSPNLRRPEVDEVGGSLWSRFGWVRPVVALVAVALLFTPLVKFVRRRRRVGSGLPAARILGVWREVQDQLIENGLAVVPAMTAAETVESARHHGLLDDSISAEGLVDLVRMARFSPDSVTADDVTVAVRLEQQVRSGLRRRSGLLHRLLAGFDSRSLLGVAVAKRGRLAWQPDHDPFKATPFDVWQHPRSDEADRGARVSPESQVIDLRESVPVGGDLGP